MARSASRVSTPAEGVLKQEISFPPSQPAGDPAGQENLSFWEHLCDVPENQWASEGEKGFRVYLYDHDSPGSKYLAVVFHPFDIEWVKQTYGGGRYRGQLNDSSGRIVSKEIFSIDGEPRRKPPQSAQAQSAPLPTDGFQSQVLQILREGQERQERLLAQVLDRDRNPAPAASSVDPTAIFRGMVDMFKEFMPQNKPMDLLETVALIDKLRGPDLLATLKAAREAGIIPAAGGSADLVTQFKQLKEAAEVIGLGEGKGKSLGEAVIEKLPDILEAGGKALDKYHNIEQTRLATAREVRVIQQNGRAVITPPPAGSPAANPAQQHHAVQQQVIPPGPGTSGLEVEAPGASTPEALAEAERVDRLVKTKVVECFANGLDGVQIVDFLDTMDRRICDQFKGASVEELAAYFNNDPILKKATQVPHFKTVLAEIVEEINAPAEEIEQPTRPN